METVDKTISIVNHANRMTGWLYLAGAIALEIIATSALKASSGFTRPLHTAVVVAGYMGAFYCLSLALRTIPMGIAYALWSAVGIVAISAVGALVYRQALDLAAIAGMSMIVAGVLVINLLSTSARHGSAVRADMPAAMREM